MEKNDCIRPHDTVRSQLRLPAELHERLRLVSNVTGRSMNAEIVRRLEESFELQEAPAAINDRQLLRAAFELVKSAREQVVAIEGDIAKAQDGDPSAIDWAGSVENARLVAGMFREQESKARHGVGVVARMLGEKKPVPQEWRLWFLENGISLR